MQDMYDQFASDYDKFGSIEEYLADEKEFFTALFSKYQVKTVLDCACGTGQHLYMLAQAGYAVSGSDYSNAMLRVARENLARHNVEATLRQCDFRYLERVFTSRFDAVVCLTTSLPHLHAEEDLLLALRSMKNRLNKNGVLVLTQGTTHYTLTLPAIEVVVNRESFSRIFVKEHDDMFQTIHVLDLFHGGGRFESNQYDVVYRILLDDDYRALLNKAGFRHVHLYGDYNFTPYNAKSRRLVVVAEQ